MRVGVQTPGAGNVQRLVRASGGSERSSGPSEAVGGEEGGGPGVACAGPASTRGEEGTRAREKRKYRPSGARHRARGPWPVVERQGEGREVGAEGCTSQS